MTAEHRISLCHWGAFSATIEDGRLTRAEPLPGSGASAEMIGTWPQLVYSDLRIKMPMVRRGFLKDRGASDGAMRGRDAFVEVSWNEALDLVAHELTRVRAERGPSGIFGGSYGWSSAGRFHHARTQVRRFLSAGGGFVDQFGNYSWGAAQAILPHVLGDFEAVSEAATSWPTIAEHADLVVAFGGLNPKNWSVTSGGAGSHKMPDWTREARRRGVSFVSISPLKSDAPDWVDAEWIAPKPNTDTAMMLALAHTLIVEDRHDKAFLDRYCAGFEPFRDYLLGATDGQAKSVDWAADITGVSAGTMRALARRMADGGTLLTASWSLQRGDHGEQPYWALIALAALLGQIGLPGRGFSFGYGSLNGVGAVRRRGLTPIMPPIPNPAGLAIPVARVADMLLNPGHDVDCNGKTFTYPDIGLVYWAGGNPFHHHQDLNRFAKAWARPETIVVHESWWTPTAKRADIVLPATTTAERADIGGSSRDPHVFAMPKLIDLVGGARNDFDIFSDLAERLGCASDYTGGLGETGWLDKLFDQMCSAARKQGLEPPERDPFWRDGVWHVPPPDEDEVLLSGFRSAPDDNALATPSGRIEIFSETIAGFGYSDCPPHPSWLPSTEGPDSERSASYPLCLLTNQPATRLHSQLGQTQAGRRDAVADREPLNLHPDDAAARGIIEGDVVRIFNDRGACLAGAVLNAELRPGTIVMATGSWYDPIADGPLAGLDKRGNPNVLTRDKGTSALGQAVSALTVLVEVETFSGDLPKVTAFDAPEIVCRNEPDAA